jgi:uncharacterized protein YegL
MSEPILPFYLVCDESMSSYAGIEALNDSLRGFHAEVKANHPVAKQTMFCLIGFGDSARLVLPPTHMGALTDIPRLKGGLTKGQSSCAAALNMLYDLISVSAHVTGATNERLSRPAVFFLAGTTPDSKISRDGPWTAAHQRLTDPSQPWHPDIVAFGGEGSKQGLQRIATVRAFTLNGALTPDRALREVVQALGRSIIASSHAQTQDGTAQFVAPERVRGFDTLPPGGPSGGSDNPVRPGLYQRVFTPGTAITPLSTPAAAAGTQARTAALPSVPVRSRVTARKVSTSRGTPAAPNASAAPGAAHTVPSTAQQPGPVRDTAEPASLSAPVPQSASRAEGAAARSPASAQAASPAFPSAPAFGRQALAPRPLLNGLPVDWHRVPDTVLDGADLKGLAVRGASLRGNAHRDKGVTRQDAMGIYQVNADGIEVILGVVADGKDGEPLSHLGAEQACLLVRDEVTARLPYLFGGGSNGDLAHVCNDIAQSVAARLAQRAGFLKAPPGALSTTLAAAMVEAGGTARSRRCVLFGVGDCAGLLNYNGALIPVTHLSRDAVMLPDRVGDVAAHEVSLDKGNALILCTPGLEKPLRQPEVRDQFLKWWQPDHVATLPEFAWQLSFRAKSGDEDRTAICFLAR